MKPARRQPSSRPGPSRELVRTRARLAEAEATLRAVRSGEVDSVVIPGKQGRQVFTLQGAEHAYRVLIESMNEGALTLTADKTILFANQRFAQMVNCPLEQVLGSSFRRFLSAEDRATLRKAIQRAAKSGSKFQVVLNAAHRSPLPAQISIRALGKEGGNGAAIGMVVTDLTDARRTEEMLRALTHRVVEVQEAERGRVALELHNRVTQLLCAILVRSQTLAEQLSSRAGPAKREAVKLRELLGQAAEEVERISRNLRPSVLDELGLAAVLRDTCTEFADRTGVSIHLACAPLPARLQAGTELTLYRILQEALKNVERHAHAHHVTVSLRQESDCLRLAILDDGIGFDFGLHSAKRNGRSGLGLLSMRERATFVGGALRVKSARRTGTEIEVRVPVPPSAARRPRAASH